MTRRRAQGEGSIFFDASRDRWVGLAWIGDTRRKVSGKTKREVTDKVARLRVATAAELEVKATMTVAQALEQWRTKRVPELDSTPATVENYDWAIGRWNGAIGRRKAAELRPADIEAALAKMMKARPMSRATMVKLRAVLNMAMAWTELRGEIPRNPVVGVALPKGTPSREKVALTAPQLRDLSAELHGHDLEALFLLSAGCGLRPGEAAAVTVDALDLEAGTVSVVQTRRAKGSRPYIAPETKTAGSRRTVELPAVTLDALHRHLDKTGITGGLLFATPTGGPLWPSSDRAALRKACEAAEVPVVSPNELRHTYATLAREAGVPAHVIAHSMGHTSTRMVEAHYFHRPEVARGGRAMDAVFTAAPDLRVVS